MVEEVTQDAPFELLAQHGVIRVELEKIFGFDSVLGFVWRSGKTTVVSFANQATQTTQTNDPDELPRRLRFVPARARLVLSRTSLLSGANSDVDDPKQRRVSASTSGRFGDVHSHMLGVRCSQTRASRLCQRLRPRILGAGWQVAPASPVMSSRSVQHASARHLVSPCRFWAVLACVTPVSALFLSGFSPRFAGSMPA